MTTHPKNTLMSMGQELPTVTKNLRAAIDNIDATKVAVQEQIDALENQVMSAMASASIVWIREKAYSLSPTYSFITSGTFGIDNVTDWGIFDPNVDTGRPYYNVFLDTDVTSGSPVLEETKQYNRQIEFPIVYDHIHHTTGLDGSYGLLDKLSSMDDGKALTLANETQYTGILKIADKYSGEKIW